MNADSIIFLISAVVAVFGAIMMITVRNPVAAVLYLILSLVAQAVCYVQLGALFVGAILIVVYAGAIMVLFLFVIMLLNLRGTEELGTSPGVVSRFTRYTITVLLIMEFLFIIKGVPFQALTSGVLSIPVDQFGSIESVAKLMFTKYMYPFQLTGILLTVAVVGAVVMARRDEPDDPGYEATEAGLPVHGSDDGKVN